MRDNGVRIYYFTPYDLLRPRTNQVSDVRFCEGFAENNCKVTLFAPLVLRKDNIERKNINLVYGIVKPFGIRYLPTYFKSDVDGKWNFLLIIFFNFFIQLAIFFKSLFTDNKNVIISRNPLLLFVAILLKRSLFIGISNLKIIYWSHEITGKKLHQWIYKKADGVVGTNSAITDDLESIFNLPKQRLAVSLNPISRSQLNSELRKTEARKNINISLEKILIVYTGKLGIGIKEVEYLLLAAKGLPEYFFLFTGGKPELVLQLRKWCGERDVHNVIFTGYLSDYSQIVNYQEAADVLVSYYTKQDHNVRYNFPNKICEYMLTGNPIVTPDFPATRDVLNEHNAIFVEPENVDSLAKGIKRAVEDKVESAKLSLQARIDVKNMTFEKRTKMLVDFFETLFAIKD